MKLPLVLISGGLVAAGVCLWLFLAIPSEPPPGVKAPESEIIKPVAKALPPGPEMVKEPVPAVPTATPTTVPAPAPKPSTPTSTVQAPPSPPPTLPTAATLPSRADLVAELDNVRLMFRDYRTLMGENPVGSNAEIMKSVMGGNPKYAKLGPPEGQATNGAGELIDRWGTPYFFHQLSATNMEIRSAGPDKIMWTSDDVVVH